MPRARVSSSVDLPPFQALIDAHGRDVHRFLIASVGRVDADDCYQETWISALRAYPRLRDGSNLRGWILTVAHNKAIDHVRAGSRRAIPVPDAPELADTHGRAHDGGGDPAAGGPSAGVWGHVRELPPKQRTAVALRFVVDAAYAEIAAVMATSEEAARRNVHEGLTRLRKEYRP
jgi:DNA-directed RNA polymerase specialized sigma24 family protein